MESDPGCSQQSICSGETADSSNAVTLHICTITALVSGVRNEYCAGSAGEYAQYREERAD